MENMDANLIKYREKNGEEERKTKFKVSVSDTHTIFIPNQRIEKIVLVFLRWVLIMCFNRKYNKDISDHGYDDMIGPEAKCYKLDAELQPCTK